MGMHEVLEFKNYWNQDLAIGSIHTISLHMEQNCFEALWQYFHISNSMLHHEAPSQPEEIRAEEQAVNEEEIAIAQELGKV